jgi:hypothetical protein
VIFIYISSLSILIKIHNLILLILSTNNLLMNGHTKVICIYCANLTNNLHYIKIFALRDECFILFIYIKNILINQRQRFICVIKIRILLFKVYIYNCYYYVSFILKICN